MWCPHMSPLQQFFTVPYVQHHVIFYPHVPKKTKVSRHLAFVAGIAGQSAHCEVRGWSCWVCSGGQAPHDFDSDYGNVWVWNNAFFWLCGECDSELICFDCDFGHSWFKDVLWLWSWIQLGADSETSFVLGLCLFDCDHDIDSATIILLIVISSLILKPVLPFALGNEIQVETSW